MTIGGKSTQTYKPFEYEVEADGKQYAVKVHVHDVLTEPQRVIGSSISLERLVRSESKSWAPTLRNPFGVKSEEKVERYTDLILLNVCYESTDFNHFIVDLNINIANSVVNQKLNFDPHHRGQKEYERDTVTLFSKAFDYLQQKMFQTEFDIARQTSGELDDAEYFLECEED